MKKSILISFLLAVTTILGVSQTAHALTVVAQRDMPQSQAQPSSQQTPPQTQSGQPESTEPKVEGTQTGHDKKIEQRAEMEAKRSAIEQKIADKRASVSVKLSGEKAERCKQRESSINQVLDNRVAIAQEHLDKLQAIEERLQTFAAEKHLAVENAKAFDIIFPSHLASAQAAVSAIADFDFDCTAADANAPGGIVMEQIATTKQALRDYASAIKDYADQVKAAATANEQGSTLESDTTDAGTDTETPAQDTPDEEQAQ